MRREAESLEKLLVKSLLFFKKEGEVPLFPLDSVLFVCGTQDCCGHPATSLRVNPVLQQKED